MELSIPIPKTPDGKANQQCPDPDCRPGLFQLGSAPAERTNERTQFMRRIPGSGDTICPYCGRMASDQEFIDPADIEAAKREIAWAAERDMADALRDMARTFNREVPSGGLISLRMDVKGPSRPRPVAWREDLLRDLTCHLCGRQYGVYAIGLFCPDCGGANLGTHFGRELDLVRQQTELAEHRRGEGKRELAYRLLGNAHEDVLTAFETYQKTVFCFLVARRSDSEPVRNKFGGNWFQNVERARKAYARLGWDPFAVLDEKDLKFMKLNIEKRHVVGHNLSVADDTYTDATQSNEPPGRTVQLLAEEIVRFADSCGRVIQCLNDQVAASVFDTPS
jgi:hypothetical protein